MAKVEGEAGGSTEDLNEESSVWGGTEEELAAKSAPDESKETANVDKVAGPAGNTTENPTEKDDAKGGSPAVAGDGKTDDIASPESETKDEANGGGGEDEAKSGIFAKILSPLSGIKEKVSPGKIIGFLKAKVSLVKDKEIMGVLKNPWIIANGVILVVALSMTVIIVLWFKTSANKINVALSDFVQLQSEQKKGSTMSESAKNVGEMPVVETLDVNEEFSAFLDSADEWFSKTEYQALAFYKALVSIKSDIVVDDSFLDLRIGESYLRLGVYKKAIDALNKVLHAKSSSQENKWRSEYMLAECFMKLGDYDKGRRALYKLIAMEGDFPPAIKELVEPSYFSIANAYLEEAQIKLAKRD
ncbi:MAG: tetratricopeptide repeat protein [Candidatus Anammoxibacter sp.]